MTICICSNSSSTPRGKVGFNQSPTWPDWFSYIFPTLTNSIVALAGLLWNNMEPAWAGLLTAVAHHCWGWLTICSAIIDFGPDGKLISGPRGTNPHILHCVILLQHIQLEAHRLYYRICTVYIVQYSNLWSVNFSCWLLQELTDYCSRSNWFLTAERVSEHFVSP